MHARVITFEVHARPALDDAQEAFERLVVPEMRRLPATTAHTCCARATRTERSSCCGRRRDTLQSGEATPGLSEQMSRLRPLLGQHPAYTTCEVGYADHPLN